MTPLPTIPPPPPLAYSWSTLSQAMGISRTTLRHLVNSGQLPPPVQFRGTGARGRPLQLFLAADLEAHFAPQSRRDHNQLPEAGGEGNRPSALGPSSERLERGPRA